MICFKKGIHLKIHDGKTRTKLKGTGDVAFFGSVLLGHMSVEGCT